MKVIFLPTWFDSVRGEQGLARGLPARTRPPDHPTATYRTVLALSGDVDRRKTRPAQMHHSIQQFNRGEYS